MTDISGQRLNNETKDTESQVFKSGLNKKPFPGQTVVSVFKR